MANKIGVVLALDGESKFTQAMKNAQQASKQLDTALKDLKQEYKDSANSAEYLTKQQDILKQKEEAYQRVLTAAKTGQSNAKKAYREQAEALKDLERQLEEARSALDRMSREDPGYAKQAKDVEKLSAAVDKQTANYLRAEGRLSSWDSKVAKAETDIKKNSSAVEKNAKEMNEAVSSADKLAGSFDKVGDQASGAAEKASQLGNKIKNAFIHTTVDIATREGLKLLKEGFEAAVEVGSEFEASMSEVEAISGASGNELTSLSDKAKELGRSTKFSASEVAQAYKYMGMAGWKSTQMLSGVEGILDLAAASGEDLAATSDIVTDDLTAFGMSAEEAGRMADVLAAASTNSNTNVSMLGETFKYAGAVAGSFGYTLEDVSIAAGLMANAGIKGSQAGTALRSIFTRLATDAGASANKLGALGTLTEELGVQFYEADGSMRPFKSVLVDLRKAWSGLTQEQQSNYANTIAGKNALSGFLSLMNAEEADFVKLSGAIENSTGAAKSMANVMQDNLQGAVTRMKSAAEGLGIAVFDGIKEPLTGLADMAASALGGLTEWITPERTEMDSFFDEMQSHSEAAASSFEASQATINQAVADVGNLEKYKTIIVELNGQENLNEYQKWQLKAAVDALSGSIPELAAAYDESTGKINLETDAIRDLIQAQQDQIIETAKQQASQEAMTGLFEATLTKKQAEAAKEASEGTVKALKTQKEEFVSTLDDMGKAYLDLTNGYMDQADYDTGMEALNKRLKEMGIDLSDLETHLSGETISAVHEFDTQIAAAEGDVKEANTRLEEAADLVEANQKAYEDTADTLDEAVRETTEFVRATTEATLAQQESGKASRERAKAAKNASSEERDVFEKAAEQEKSMVDLYKEGKASLLEVRREYKASAEETKNLNDKYITLNNTYGKLKEAAAGYAQAQKDAAAFEGVDEDRYDKAVYDMTRYKAVWDQHGETIKDADTVLGQYVDRLMDAEYEWSQSADKTRALQEILKDNAPTFKEGVEAAVAFADAIEEGLSDEAKSKIESVGDSFKDLGSNISQSVKDWAQNATEEANRLAAEWAKSLEDASARSAEAIRSGWQSLQDTARQTLTVSIETEFEGGADLTTETMNANLESQLEGYRDYVKNLETLRQAVAEGIITPEFFTHLEEQGTSAANEIRHMAWTLENQENGVEQVKGISDKWTEALDMQDSISRIIAGDQAALAGALKQFGSTDADFSALSSSISTGLAGADADLQAKIQGLVQTAQNVGATIPDGLAESIESGEIDAAGLEEQLNAAITGAIEGLADVAKESGAVVPEGLVAGIEDGSGDVQAAYDTLISSIATQATSSGTIEAAAQAAVTSPMAQGILAGQEEVVTAAQQTGEQAAAGFASGVSSGEADAISAAQNLASNAASAMTGGDWSGIGYNMASGVASGIANGQALAVNAAINLAKNALAGAKKEAGIASPSKKFAAEVGKQMSRGTAVGLKSGTPLAQAAARDMSSKTLKATTAWLSKYKKSHKITRKDTMFFWGQMAAVTKQGTTTYAQLLKKAEKTAKKINFGVSWTKKDSKGKVTKKDAETFYSEVYSAAQEYFDLLTMNHDMSVRQELQYWTKVRNSLRKGTKAYTDAAQKIKSIKDKIGGFDVASDMIDSFQIYHEMSEKAVMDYWDVIRKQYAAGTEDRMKADEKYLSAKKSYNEKLKALEDDYNNKVKETNQKYTDALKERTEAIAGAFDIFDAYESESVTGEELLFNIKSQAEGYKFWTEQISKLSKRGILSSDLMGALTEKGPENSASIYALNQLTEKQLKEYNEAYQKKMDLSRQQATKDTESIKKEVSAELAKLSKERTADLAKLNAGIASQLTAQAKNIRNIADDEVAKIINAMNKSMAMTSSSGGGGSSAGGTTAAKTTGTPTSGAAKSTTAAKATSGTSSSNKVTKSQVTKIVKKGTKASKTNKSYSDLRNHIISKYGYDVGTYKSNTITQELGKLFGVTVSKTSTAAQRTKLLNAMKKAGLRSGSRRVNGIPVWMDEDGLGSEMVISRADNAVLTRIPAGSAVAPSGLTDNLWQWGSFAPAQFLAQMDRRQAAMAAYVNQMVGSATSAAVLNSRLVSSPATVMGAASKDAEVLETIVGLLSRYLPGIEESRDTYMDGRKVTSALSDSMSNELAMRSRRRRR